MNNNYSRRKFMKTVVVSAGAVGATGLTGCGGDSNEYNDATVEVTSVDTNGSRFPQSVASGDPRARSIVLWTRVDAGLGEKTVTVQVATDEDFDNIVVSADLSATFANDHCVKVKVTDLSRYKRYYYRFVHEGVASRTGRFRTAPGSNSGKDVKFGFVSCQDYTNGFYNAYLKFLESDNDDIDFIVHLGDYIYETTGDAFQGSVRTSSFSDETDAVDTGESLAAATVSQYRDLYKTYRSDPAIQRVHERFPFITIWDDHEFSDDSWQENGTYFDAMADEASVERKRNSEKAFFEYMPLDIDPTTGNLLGSGQAEEDKSELFQSVIYRSFRWGQRLNLVMTDYRTYRPDHLIPEDGFPGTVVMDELATGQTLYATPGDPFGFKAGVDAALNAASEGAITEISDIKNPNALDIQVLRGAVRNAVAGGLALFPYVNIDNVTNAELGAFIAALNATLAGAQAGGAPVVPISANPNPTLKELLIYALTAAYQDEDSVAVPLSAADAQAKAISVVDGNLDIISINGTLHSFYTGLLTTVNAIGGGLGLPVPFDNYDAMFATLAVAFGQPNLVAALGTSQKFLPDFNEDSFTDGDGDPVGVLDNSGGNPALTDAEAEGIALAGLDVGSDGDFDDVGDIPPDTTWGFEGFGVSYAIMGKSGLSSDFGSRYLVVKSTFELLNLYHALVLETENFGLPWGGDQQSAVLINLTTSSADWNVLGSSVSFTSLILDASEGGLLDGSLDLLGVSSDDFPRTAYLMNVDHWDGFPLTRGAYMNDSAGNLAAVGANTLQDTNTVIISGDIHAAFVTDHGANAEGTGRCLEFTTTAVSSGTFGSFTAGGIASILGVPAEFAGIVNLVDNLGGFLQAGAPANTIAPQTLNFADPNANGVSIMELTSSKLTCNMYLLDTTSSDGDATLLSTSQYTGLSTDAEFTAAADDFADSFTVVTRSSTKQANGQNGELA